MITFLALFATFLSAPSFADTPRDPVAPGTATEEAGAPVAPQPAEPPQPPAHPDPVAKEVESQPRPESGVFKSITPLAGYNPTFGVFVGGGYFRKVVEENLQKSSWGFIAVISQFRRAVKTEFKGEARIDSHWRAEWRNEIAHGFESNFGLGNETRVEDRVDVMQLKNELDLAFPYYFSDRFAIGIGFEHRARRNDPLTSYERARQVDPEPDTEFTGAAQLLERVDYRNIPENPSLGWLQELRVTRVWPYGGPKRQPSLMLDFEISMFQYLRSRDLVLAYGLAGGQIFGEPTWLNQFRLGGTDRLRGYYYGRFRGSAYYLTQTELRFPIYKFLSGVTFGEFGEVTAREKDPFTRAHVSYGGGLRIGLPPDNVAKIRIDYAIGRDQRGVFVDFGHAF